MTRPATGGHHRSAVRAGEEAGGYTARSERVGTARDLNPESADQEGILAGAVGAEDKELDHGPPVILRGA